MKQASCPHEVDVLRAARADEWNESLRAHAAECARCRDLVQVTAFMNKLGAAEDRQAPLPDPELVWLKAQVLARQAQKERALKPLVLAEALGQAAAALAVGAFLTWKWPLVTVVVTDFGRHYWGLEWLSTWARYLSRHLPL